MKKIYIVALLTLGSPVSIYADNQFDFNAELSAIAHSALEAIDKQMAIKINLSGKQRMLTQKMSKEVLLTALNIDSERNRSSLKASAELFEKTLKGLQKGDESLDLTKTTDTDILNQLTKVETLWTEFKAHIDKAVNGNLGKGSDTNTLQAIAKLNLPLLSEMNKAVSMYALNSGAELDKLATVINLSGKQRMLTQKMIKELLLVANDIDKESNQKNLQETIQLFDKTLTGLMTGDKELGLPKTTDNTIIKQLEKVQQLWATLKPLVEKGSTSKDALEKAAELNLPLLKEMNKAVKLYESQSDK